MKTFKHILPFLLALLVLAGCEDDVTYKQGAAENPDCYGVYFPKKQATRTDLEFEPGTQTEAIYTVKRRNAVDPIVVPIVVTSNVENIFVVEPIAFEAGEDETTFKISFPGAQMGTTYTCDISIEDPRYASVYAPDKVSLSISLVLAKWELVTDEKTGETKGRYRDDILGNFASINNPNANPNPEIQLEIYERSDKKGYYRMKAYTPELMNIFAGGPVNHENRGVWTYVDATDPEKVYYPYQSTGLTLFPEMGEWFIASQTPENFAMDGGAGQYGTLKNGVITFPAQSILLEPSEGESAGKFFYANAHGLQRVMLPGARVYDYSVALTKSEPADGVVKIGATLSKDTREFRYAIFAGNLSDGEASLKAQEMADGKIAAENIETITASGTISVQDLKEGTGKYTLVGCIYGAGEPNPEGGETASENLKMQGYAFIPFGYVAKGDKVSVILKVGLESTNEFAGQGITSDNSAKFWAYGEGIESLKYGVFKTKDIKNVDLTTFLQQNGEVFSPEQLEAINSGHYSVMLTGLNGNTEYTFAGLAYNGYVSTLVKATIKTTGKFNPGLESEFLYTDFLPQDKQPKKEYLISTQWNYYAINLLDKKPMRRKIGTVTIADDPKDDSSADLLTITGLPGVKFDKGGQIPAVYVPAASPLAGITGAISPLLSQTPIGTINGEEILSGCVSDEKPDALYAVNYPFIGGAVADGYIYFVPTPNYIEQGATFRYLYTLSATAPYSILTDMLLVDPAKDMGGIPELAEERIADLRRMAAELRQPRNYVERLEYSASADRSSVKPLPTNHAKGFLPASAPEAKVVEATVGFSEAVQHAEGAGSELRFRKTAAAKVTLK
ncbi:hypothetical protein [Alistipes sp.]|uniref:hypothetical protein n=1 Tax=Alistipes sp. TaxID=1872444 RepID=UPI0025C1FECA|nr:hypothetical protein [Alistipes sp.]